MASLPLPPPRRAPPCRRLPNQPFCLKGLMWQNLQNHIRGSLLESYICIHGSLSAWDWGRQVSGGRHRLSVCRPSECSEPGSSWAGWCGLITELKM